MGTESVAVVRRLFDAFERRDVEGAIELVDPGFLLAAPRTGQAAGQPNQLYTSHEGVRKYFADVEDVWRKLELQPGEYREHGDFVVAIGRLRAQSATGQESDTQAAWAFRIRAGKVTWARIYTDAAAALRDVGFPGDV